MTEERTDARSRAVDLAIGQIEKQFGRGAIMRLGEKTNLEIEAIPTGSLA
ncbi:MAG TPA: DNA recombination/repair protein RecA, partial [Dehalococcoidia bacterium]